MSLQAEYNNSQGAIGGHSASSSTQPIRPRYALVANKIDQEHLRVIKSERHHKFAQVNTEPWKWFGVLFCLFLYGYVYSLWF